MESRPISQPRAAKRKLAPAPGSARASRAAIDALVNRTRARLARSLRREKISSFGFLRVLRATQKIVPIRTRPQIGGVLISKLERGLSQAAARGMWEQLENQAGVFACGHAAGWDNPRSGQIRTLPTN